MANAGVIDDIPDLDGPSELTSGVNALHLDSTAVPADIPDMDDIPDMEEDDLEAGDEATAAPTKAVANPRSALPSRVLRH